MTPPGVRRAAAGRRDDEGDAAALAEGLRRGDMRALARAISRVEDDPEKAGALLRRVYPLPGRAAVAGITGAPGAGKSTLVDRLIGAFRARGRRVAVLCVDPSSPFSGGAILGDRIRMMGRAADTDVFIRSMATRGFLGGLARATADAMDLVEAAGFDVVLVETIGVGQDEVEIARTAPTTVLVLTPEGGDEVQAIKAGLMEIADIFVVNKADTPAAARMEAHLRSLLSLSEAPEEAKPPVFRTVATRGEGVEALADAIEGHGRRIARDGRLGTFRRRKVERRLHLALQDRVMRRIYASPERDVDRAVELVLRGEADPHSAAELLLRRASA